MGTMILILANVTRKVEVCKKGQVSHYGHVYNRELPGLVGEVTETGMQWVLMVVPGQDCTK